MTLTLPTAGITPGASADRRVSGADIGAEVRDLGAAVQQFGLGIRQRQDDRAFARAQLRMLEQFNALELEVSQIGDPDAMDATFRARAPGVMVQGQPRPGTVPILDAAIADLPDDVRTRLMPRLDEVYERIRIGAAQGVGRSVLAQQQSAMIEMVDGYRQVSLNAATNPASSPETALASFEAYEAQLDALVANGTITPERRGDLLRGWETDLAQTRATDLLANDPETLLTQIDSEDFAALAPENRASYRARATAALEARQREAGAALSQRLREGTRVLRAGYDYADAAALAADPATAATPEGREFLAALELHRARPDLARMTPRAQAELVAEVERQPVAGGDGFQTEQRAALRAVVAASTEAWSRDPLGHALQLGMHPIEALPDPATADPAALYSAIRTRAAQAIALRDGGYTEAPVLLRPEERAAFAAVTGLDADPRDRARVAGDLAAALGPDLAPSLIGQFSDDPVFGFIGGMVAKTGNTPLAAEVFEGQRALESRDVPLPSEATRRNTHFRLGLGEGGVLSEYADRALINQMIGAADALAARRLRGRDPADLGEDAYFEIAAQALHEVMGGTGTRDGRDARGGIQSLNGAPTLMPMGVSAREADARLRRLAGALDQTWTATGPVIQPEALDLLRAVSADGRLPSIGGEPMDGETLRSLVFQAAPDGTYHAFLDGQPLQVMTEDGTPWRLDMRALVEWQP